MMGFFGCMHKLWAPGSILCLEEKFLEPVVLLVFLAGTNLSSFKTKGFVCLAQPNHKGRKGCNTETCTFSKKSTK